jgi:iron-sulfur cluster assembly accessory protein
MNHQSIKFTPSAIEQAKDLEATVKKYSGKPLRLYLDGKGCDGFFYGVCFDEHRQGDEVIEQDAVTLVVDQETYQFVEGSTIDWVDDERGAGFLVENPNHKKFRGKFFKRKQWQERLLDT